MDRIKQLVAGTEVPIYYDWQNQKELLGYGKLTSYVSDGYTFIPEAQENAKVPIVYGHEKWMVKITSTTDRGGERGYNSDTTYLFKIPYILGKDRRYLKESDPKPSISTSLTPDSFIKVNGKSVF